MTPLHVYKSPSGRYKLATEEAEGRQIASFANAGQHLPNVLTKLMLMEDGTVADPLNGILDVIYEHLSTDLQEEWTQYITPCHRDSASNATQIKKTLKTKLGESRAQTASEPISRTNSLKTRSGYQAAR